MDERLGQSLGSGDELQTNTEITEAGFWVWGLGFRATQEEASIQNGHPSWF